MFSLQRNRPRSANGFTMLEVIVTLVVLGALAVVAVPTYTKMYERAHDEKAALAVESAIVMALGSAVFRNDGTFVPEDFTYASTSSLAPGTSATEGLSITFTQGESEGYGSVSWALAPDGQSVGMAMYSGSGRCVHGWSRGDASERTVTPAAPVERCTGHAAGELLAGWGAIDGPTGSVPEFLEDVTGFFELSLPKGHLLEVSVGGEYSTESLSIPGLLSLDVTQPSAGEDTARITVTPDPDAYGPFELSLRSTNGAGDRSDSSSFPTQVIPANDAPLADPTVTVVITDEGAVDVPSFMSGDDPKDVGRDGYPAAGPVVAFEVVQVPTAGTLRVDVDPGSLAEWVTASPGSLTNNPELRYTPDPNTVGVFTASYRVADAGFPAPARWSEPAVATWSFEPVEEPVVPNTAPTSPVGSLPQTEEGRSTSGEFTTTDPDGAAWTFEISDEPDGTFVAADLVLEGKGLVTVENSTTSDMSTLVTFQPLAEFGGEASFWIRANDAAGGVSSPSLVTATVACRVGVDHSFASPCAPTGRAVFLANTLNMENNFVIRGDSIITGTTTVTNQSLLSRDVSGADVSGAGRGSLFTKDLVVENGSNLYVSGDVWASGGLVNRSPQTVIAGDLKMSGGSVKAYKRLTVNGTVVASNTTQISGDLVAKSVVRSEVSTPPLVFPRFSVDHATYDVTFATWAEATAWLQANSGALGAPGRERVHVTDPNAGSLSLAGKLSGHFLLVTEGPTRLNAWPTAAAGSSISILARSDALSKDVPSLVIAAAGDSPVEANTTLYTEGRLSFTQRNVLYGQMVASEFSVQQSTELVGRLAAKWAAEILRS